MTKRAKPIFTVKQYPSHQPWICIEYLQREEGMPKELFGFDIAEGTPFEKAKEIAEFMNDNLQHFTVTK